MIFTRFTREARRCVAAAPEEARLLGHDSVGDEDLLLGILQCRDTLSAGVLRGAGVYVETVREESGRMMSDSLASIGISFEDIRRETGDSFDMKLPEDRKIPFSPGAKKALEQSLREALELNDNSLTPEHLLLAILREEDGTATRLLERLSVSPEIIRTRLFEAMKKAG